MKELKKVASKVNKFMDIILGENVSVHGRSPTWKVFLEHLNQQNKR